MLALSDANLSKKIDELKSLFTETELKYLEMKRSIK
jgi:hypothetical protein